MATLAHLDEQGFIDLIARLSRRSRVRPVLGIGDDAAVVSVPSRVQTLITTDLLADGVHFRSDRTPGHLLGRKAQTRSVPGRPGDQIRTSACIDKIRDKLGYSPRVSLEEGLRETVEWFQANPYCADSP